MTGDLRLLSKVGSSVTGLGAVSPADWHAAVR